MRPARCTSRRCGSSSAPCKARMLSLLPQLLVSGTSTGMLYALIALSMTVVYRATTVVNFGHGDMVAAGAYAVFVFGLGFGLPFLVAMTLAIALLFAAGLCRAAPAVAADRRRSASVAGDDGARHRLHAARRAAPGMGQRDDQPVAPLSAGRLPVRQRRRHHRRCRDLRLRPAAAGGAVPAVAGDAARQGDPGDVPEPARRCAGRHQRPAVPRADVGRRRGARRDRRRDAVADHAADARSRPVDAGAGFRRDDARRIRFARRRRRRRHPARHHREAARLLRQDGVHRDHRLSRADPRADAAAARPVRPPRRLCAS